jgi:hypothetical protein
VSISEYFRFRLYDDGQKIRNCEGFHYHSRLNFVCGGKPQNGAWGTDTFGTLSDHLAIVNLQKSSAKSAATSPPDQRFSAIFAAQPSR